ncbi:MAG: sterol-binding protein [Candidatus Dadabacteria bacterium]|nr:MAG: sterol-binding protein [Candidatus Dadabacteria bacterium]
MAELTSVKEVFEQMPSRFNAAAAAGVNATYQFDLTGEGGATYHVKIADGKCEVKEGAAENPNITITMAASDYLDMINGKLNPQMAFMGGKLKIKGDMSLALKMQQIFPNP